MLSSGPANAAVIRESTPGGIDMTAANRSSFEPKNCITRDASTPASAAIFRIDVDAYPSRAKRARAASRIAVRVTFAPGRRPIAGRFGGFARSLVIPRQFTDPRAEGATCLAVET